MLCNGTRGESTSYAYGFHHISWCACTGKPAVSYAHDNPTARSVYDLLPADTRRFELGIARDTPEPGQILRDEHALNIAIRRSLRGRSAEPVDYCGKM